MKKAAWRAPDGFLYCPLCRKRSGAQSGPGQFKYPVTLTKHLLRVHGISNDEFMEGVTAMCASRVASIIINAHEKHEVLPRVKLPGEYGTERDGW